MTKLDILANTRSRYHERRPHCAANEKHLCGLTLSRLVNTRGGRSKKWWVLFYVLLVLCTCSLLPPFVGHAVLTKIMSQTPALKIPHILYNVLTKHACLQHCTSLLWPNIYIYYRLFFFSWILNSLNGLQLFLSGGQVFLLRHVLLTSPSIL